ncbi:substrate-binding domain-containing protein [Micromonospora narathiwatensis]|uniref:Amino acid/amide ABC transporter substrate-binding protein, HAAT family (TC 3.A.1.4.-) n=1 Tax=Micromonospora narathiwatensis TaxID=299146 RepID=A0A1A9A6R4_9ACTN|nr:substrate-binding domain-containing protein [Micromonospora narathiwatensis]SBT51808.1 amino acid/amide ABC transporter substrate-binding protein, HAAT family (TC 3.A.1.4.-) [Micromonospora narathiwatensis]
MTIRHTRRAFLSAATMMAAAMAATACGSPQDTASGGGDAAPVKVGLVYSQSGPLASYGKQYIEGFKAGLDYATKGTGKVGDRKIELTEVDDAGDPAKAVSAAKDLIGKGYKIIGGSSSSGVALQVAPIAAQNKVLNISGAAATDAITGANRYTFRSGRQSYQDVVTAKSFIGDATGKKVVVFAQEGAFGDANEAAVKAVIGGAGATVSSVRAPASATEFTPFASQIKNAKPDLLFVAWAGTTAPTMWQNLDQQGVLASTQVVTGLDLRASWPTFGAAGSKISFLSHYFEGASDNEAAKALKAKVGTIDLFHPDGFAGAQMVVRAVQEGGDDVEKMIKALEGWQFDGVKGQMTIRPEDHALLQPMYQAKLSGSGTEYTATAQKTLTGDETAPPVTQMKG